MSTEKDKVLTQKAVDDARIFGKRVKWIMVLTGFLALFGAGQVFRMVIASQKYAEEGWVVIPRGNMVVQPESIIMDRLKAHYGAHPGQKGEWNRGMHFQSSGFGQHSKATTRERAA